ncbi:hypothetical protein PRZ48_012290 [Zasmidium cellare]|uniref:PHD-type domain-containing protein n=1 Tax=Zasmidium cellare TaxID=395010 RepID=A0ABR0E4E5_ZASCE|nr:hypothetical protein PRZ48_012290 [Zasmidium cellare]
MSPAEDSRRTHDLFRRMPATQPKDNARPPSPEEYNFLNAAGERRNQGQQLRNQPALRDGHRRHNSSYSNDDPYRPPRRTYERSPSPPIVKSSPQAGPYPQSPRLRRDDSRVELFPSHRRQPSSRTRDSGPAPHISDFREPANRDSYRVDRRDPREPPSPADRRREGRPKPSSPLDRDVPKLNHWHSSPAVPSAAARRNDARSPHEEPSYSTSSIGTGELSYANMRWMNPQPSPAQPVKSFGAEEEPRTGDNSASTVEKADVNGIKGVPVGPAKSGKPPVRRRPTKGGIPPVPQSKLQLPHISFAGTLEGRSNLYQCEKAHNGGKLFGKYWLDMQLFPQGQQQDQDQDDHQHPTTSAAATISPKPSELDPAPKSDKIRMVLDALAGERDDGVAASLTSAVKVPPEQPAGALDESVTNAGCLTSHLVQSRSDARPQSTLQLLRSSPARPESPLGSTSSVSGRTASDVSGRGPRRCHVCNKRFELDNLVKCTTCSRRYHRHCYTGKPIPAVVGDHWQCQRCERKKIPLNKSRLAHVDTGVSVEATAPSKPATESTPPSVGSPHGSSDYDPASLFPPEQTQVEKQPEPAERQRSSPMPHADVEAAQADPLAPAETSMASHADTLPVRTNQVDSDDVHFTEAHDLVDKSFSAAASSLQADRVDKPTRKPGKLQFTKRKRADTQERVRPSDNDISVFDIPQEEEPGAKLAGGATDFAPRVRDVEASTAMPGVELHENPAETPRPENTTPNVQPVVDSASPVDSVLHITKRKKGPSAAMAPCVECGSQTAKALVGPTTCSKCRKRKKEEAARLDLNSASHTSREGTLEAAVPSMTEDKPAQSSFAGEMPRQVIEEETEGPQATGPAMPSNPGQQPGEVPDNSCDDASMLDVVVDDNEDTNALFEDVDMVNGPHDTSANGQEDEAMLQELVEASQAPTTPGRKTQRIKRKSQQAVARDEYDLGSSFERPKKTYERLIGMALIDAPANRLQSKDIVEWISTNVPEYDKTEGIWANGIKATLRLNATGKCGKVICRQVEWAEGDDGEPGKDWWVLKPDVKDTLDRWDHRLKRPTLGPKTSQLNEQGPLELDNADEVDADEVDADDIEIDRQARLLDAATTSQSKKTNPVKTAGKKRATKSATHATEPDAMDVDAIDDNGQHGVPDVESSDEEPLASRAKTRHSLVSTVSQRTASFHSELDGTPGKAPHTTSDKVPLPASQHETKDMDITSLLAAPGPYPVRDDLYVRGLIHEEVENIDFSKEDLKDWPEYRPQNHFDREQKIAEIKARPNRKQLFGKPATASMLDAPLDIMRPPSLAPALTVLRDSEEFASIGKEPEEMEKPCNSLADFLGVREDVVYVPCIHKRNLAFKDQNPHVRNPIVTDIRLL